MLRGSPDTLIFSVDRPELLLPIRVWQGNVEVEKPFCAHSFPPGTHPFRLPLKALPKAGPFAEHRQVPRMNCTMLR